MEIGFLSILAFGFLLGVKHAMEPDHVIAVSTIAAHSKKLSRSSLAGVCWGIGHTATLFLAGMVFMSLKSGIPEKWALSFEFLVGIMLVYLGVTSVLSIRPAKWHIHKHQHNGSEHVHFHSHKHGDTHDHPVRRLYLRSMLIGLVHGLAGSAAMVLLAMSTVTTLWQGAFYILTFGAGTVLGMLVFTTLIGIPFVLSGTGTRLNRVLTQAVGVISTVYGLYYMYELGVTDGLFH